MAAPVFVSHSSKDLARVRTLVSALEARGVACWFSERDIAAGDNYGDAIVDAIERAPAMVLVFSHNANDSDEIKKEVALASQRRITVAPVRIEDVQPSKAFRYELATRNWIDLFPDTEAGVARLSDRLASIVGAAPEGATAAPTPKLAPIPPQQPSPLPAPRRLLVDAAGAVAAIAVAGAVLWFTIRPPPPVPPAPVAAPTQPAPATPVATPTQSASATPIAAPIQPTPATPVATPTQPVPAASVAAPTQSASATPVTAPIQPVPATPVATPTQSASATPIAAPIQPTPATSVAAAAQPAPATPVAAPIQPTPVTPVAAPASKPAPSLSIGPAPTIAADDPGGEVFKECDHCPEMVVVPAGKAMLGSPIGESGRQTTEMTPHEVDVAKPFAVERATITFDEWDACLAEGGCANWRPGDYGFGRSGQPVIFVSWNDAQGYVDWLKRKTGQRYRLLSEAEWEYAARGCVDLKCPHAPFWFGAITPEIAVYDSRYSYQGSPKAAPALKTAPAESGKPNPFGLYNILGNVRQWTADCWNATPSSAPSNGAPVTIGDCTAHATRGGSWDDKPAELRAAARSWESADERSPYVGFRVARTLAP
jgi:formylglycine-generating enzyme required for sulfatase activity